MAGQTVEAIDTSILVRYITGDDETQLEKATRLIETGDPKLINSIVLVELSWVLASVYKLPRDTIANTLKEVGCCGYLIYKRPKPVAGHRYARELGADKVHSDTGRQDKLFVPDRVCK